MTGGAKPANDRAVVLLGPQSTPTAGRALRDLETHGLVQRDARVAVVTAGWREREGEAGLVPDDVASRAVDVALYDRTERLAERDPELARGHKAAQAQLKLLRRAYNVRLDKLTEAYTKLGELEGDATVLDAERADALEAIRSLDERHLARVAEVRGEFAQAFDPTQREVVLAEREALSAVLENTEAVLLAGGHIATLVNRLRLFDFESLLGRRPVIAWSAGAMAIAPRIVLFHDRPPWGQGNPEAFDLGLGWVDRVQPFPHASTRLALDDRARAGRLASRFAPAACLVMDPGARVDRIDGVWKGHATRRIDRAGRLIRFKPAA